MIQCSGLLFGVDVTALVKTPPQAKYYDPGIEVF